MVDYSKWKYIDISDDEDETQHELITSPSFMLNDLRIRQTEEDRQEKNQLEKAKEWNRKKMKEIKDKLAKGSGEGADISFLRTKLEELERTEEKLRKAEEELRSKIAAWKADKISQPGFTRTLINKPRRFEEASEEDIEKRMQAFVRQNRKVLKEYGLLKKYTDSKQFLLEYPYLVCDDATNYLVIWCITLELEGKNSLSQHVARQCLCLHFILELAKQLDLEPKTCILSFFTKIQICDDDYKSHFESELKMLIGRIRKRAKAKVEVALSEQEMEEREARMGPGGLDPLEVFESLPQAWKDCFERQDVSTLQKLVAEMADEEAAYHMKRCVDSGLWLPEGGKQMERCYDDQCEEIDGLSSLP